MEALYRQGRLPGAIYSGRGQEGTHVGVAFALEKDDSLFPTHRDLSAQLTKGLDLNRVMAQFWGRIDGYTRGRDGNSHIGDWDGNRTFTVISHLPIAYPVACGAALAYKRKGERRVAMAICGDGSTSNGRWHEALNWSAVHQLPVVWVVNNNQYAYSTPNPLEFHVPTIAERAVAYGMPGVRVDGGDVVEVYEAALEAVERARDGGGPTLIESVSLRWRGHAGHDPAKYMPNELLQRYMADKDPVKQLRGVPALGGRGHEGGHRRGAGARREGVRRGVRVRAGLAVPRARRRDEGPLGRGRLLDERARSRRRDGELMATKQVEAGAAGHGAEPRGKRSDDGEATYLIAIAEALWEEMERDERVYMLGEDIGAYGGAFKVTEGFIEHFGPERVMDTPIAEETIVGMAIGSAMEGLRPVAEFQYADFMTTGFDEITTTLARYHYRSGVPLPVVLRAPSGGGVRASNFHSTNPEPWFAHQPGLKVVCPAFPSDAKGLLKSAIRDDNPVVYLEHKWIYRRIKEQVPEDPDFLIPIGKADVKRRGYRCLDRRVRRHGAPGARGGGEPRRQGRSTSRSSTSDRSCRSTRRPCSARSRRRRARSSCTSPTGSSASAPRSRP